MVDIYGGVSIFPERERGRPGERPKTMAKMDSGFRRNDDEHSRFEDQLPLCGAFSTAPGMEEMSPLNQLLLRHPEHAFDVEGVADAYLDMRFRAETGPFIYRLAFHESPAHGVDYRLIVVFSDLMKMREYHAIERASKLVRILRVS